MKPSWILVIVAVSALGITVSVSATTLVATAVGHSTTFCAPGAAGVCPAGDLDWIEVTVVESPPAQFTMVRCSASPVWMEPVCICAFQQQLTAREDPSGVATFTFNAIGGCGYIQFEAWTPNPPPSGTLSNLTSPIFVSSPDINADRTVNLSDLILFVGMYMGADPCADYNCSGSVDLSDFVIFASHYFHDC
jgi:hypothetical protein